MIKKIRYQSLKRHTFVDRNLTEIGSVEDLILAPDSLQATHLVLGAGFFEEFQEELGNKPNIDEIAALADMEQYSNTVYRVKKALDELEVTDTQGRVGFPHYLFCNLQKLKIHDLKGPTDGELHDYLISGENSAFCIQLPKFQYEMSMQGYRQKLEFLLPLNMVKINGEIITISTDTESLKSIIEKNLEMKMSGKSIIRI